MTYWFNNGEHPNEQHSASFNNGEQEASEDGTNEPRHADVQPCLPHEDLMFYIKHSALGFPEDELLDIVTHGFRDVGAAQTPGEAQPNANGSFTKHLHIAESSLLRSLSSSSGAARTGIVHHI